MAELSPQLKQENTRFLTGLRERADAHGILLVVDEAQTGFGRTAPEALMSNAPEALMSKVWPGSQGGTYGGNPVACAAAIRAQQAAAESGLLLLTCGTLGNVVRMIPALGVSGEQVDQAAEIWTKAAPPPRAAADRSGRAPGRPTSGGDRS